MTTWDALLGDTTTHGGPLGDTLRGALLGDATLRGALLGETSARAVLLGDVATRGALLGDVTICGVLPGDATTCDVLLGDATTCGVLRATGGVSKVGLLASGSPSVLLELPLLMGIPTVNPPLWPFLCWCTYREFRLWYTFRQVEHLKVRSPALSPARENLRRSTLAWLPCCCCSVCSGKGLSVGGTTQGPAPDSLSLPSTTRVCSPEYSVSVPSRSKGASWSGLSSSSAAGPSFLRAASLCNTLAPSEWLSTLFPVAVEGEWPVSMALGRGATSDWARSVSGNVPSFFLLRW